MVGLRFSQNTKLWVSRWGTLCGVFAMLVFVVGCPIVTPPVTSCTADADCTDDGLFCNGDEVCLDTEVCGHEGNPCATGTTCNEETNHCDECDAAADCDDDDPCTTDACSDALECVNTAVDCGDQFCDPATGDCVDCLEAADCDDADLCTDDACTDGVCANTAVECAEGEACDPVTGECVLACGEDVDCDDTDLCTTDTCGEDGICAYADVVCDDTDLCTDDTCDAATGCVYTAVVCDAGFECDPLTGECAEAAACTTDADCDDGVFCNGTETCDLTDPAAGVCVDGTRPCDDADADGVVITCDDGAVESCEEGDDEAVCAPCPTETLDFTVGLDNLTGTSGDDSFYAPWDYTTGGTKVNTLDTGDQGSGLAGDDVLDVTFVGSADTTIVPILTGIETINITDNTNTANTTTLKLGSSSGVTTINTVNSTDTATIADIASIVNLGIENTDAGISATYKQAATSTTADALTLTLSDVPDGATSVATIVTDSASGFETLNVVSAGSGASVLRQITTTGNSTTLKTMNISGTQNLTLRVVPDSLTTTISASGMTSPAAFQLGYGTSVTGTSAYLLFQTMDVGNLTGGPGNDVFIFAGTLTSTDADGSSEYIDGGAGTDVLQASLGASISSAPHIKNIEEFRLNATGDYTLAFPTVAAGSALATITVESDSTSSGSQNTLMLSSVPYQPTSSTALPALAYRGNGAEGNQYLDAVTYSGSGVSSGTTDSLAITVGNRGTDLGTSGSSNAFNVGLITAASIETLTVAVVDLPVSGASPTTFNSITATGMTSFDLDAEGDVVLGTVTGKTQGLATADLSGVTGRIKSTSEVKQLASSAVVTLTANNDTVTATTGEDVTGVTVNCGAGDDTITFTVTDGAGTAPNGGTVNGSTGDDTITMTVTGTNSDGYGTLNGEAGNDTLTGAANADTLSGGDGNDTISGAAGVDAITGGAGNDTITGGAGADTITTGTGTDTVVLDYALAGAAVDTVTDFATGASGDQFDIDISALETAGTSGVNAGASDFAYLDDGASVASSDTITIQEVTADVAAAADISVFVLVGATFANTGAVEDAIETGGFEIGVSAAVALGDSFLVVYSDGTDAYLADVYVAVDGGVDIDAADLVVTNLAKMSGNAAIAASEFNAANFDFID